MWASATPPRFVFIKWRYAGMHLQGEGLVNVQSLVGSTVHITVLCHNRSDGTEIAVQVWHLDGNTGGLHSM